MLPTQTIKTPVKQWIDLTRCMFCSLKNNISGQYIDQKENEDEEVHEQWELQ